MMFIPLLYPTKVRIILKIVHKKEKNVINVQKKFLFFMFFDFFLSFSVRFVIFV